MGVDRNDVPAHDISAGLQGMPEPDNEFVGGAESRFCGGNGPATFSRDMHVRKGRHHVLGEAQSQFAWRTAYGRADSGGCMIEKSMGAGGRRCEQANESRRGESGKRA